MYRMGRRPVRGEIAAVVHRARARAPRSSMRDVHGWYLHPERRSPPSRATLDGGDLSDSTAAAPSGSVQPLLGTGYVGTEYSLLQFYRSTSTRYFDGAQNFEA